MPVDHLGVAVADLAVALPAWEATLGVRAEPPELVATQRVRVAFLNAGNTHVELLEPTDPESAVGRFLAQRGEGLHHVAFEVADVNVALASVEARGGRLVDHSARPGARGRLVGFAHPTAHHGVLVEFVQAA